MIYLNIGEPDFTAAEAVRAAAEQAIERGLTQYTDARGLWSLRQALSRWYASRFGLQVEPERIMITAGASAALQLACLALVDAGDEVLMPDPSYPCNRHFVAAADGMPVLLPTDAQQRYQLGAQDVGRAWNVRTKGVLLASPSNPTGTSIDSQELHRVVDTVHSRGGFAIVDEIYLGLSYDERYAQSVLSHPAAADCVVSVNSFSKYFCMTGWRLGWMVLPKAWVPAVERLAQNLYICASSIAQHAALACFEPESLATFEARRAEFRARRDAVVPALQEIGLRVPVVPDGAFYCWVDIAQHRPDSWDFAFELMRRAQVALTPGRDFARRQAERYIRLSFARSMPELLEAVARIGNVLKS